MDKIYAAGFLAVISILLLGGLFLGGSAEKIYAPEYVAENIDSLEGEALKVKGNVSKGSIMCTQRFCPNSSCCNTCSGSVTIGENVTITLEGENIGCSGTSCNLNCTPETGEAYVFTGVPEKSMSRTYLNVSDYREVNQP